MQIDPTVVSIIGGVLAILVGLYNVRRQIARDNREMVAEMIAAKIDPLAERLGKVEAKASGAWDMATRLEARCEAEHHR